ncbi:hypothetical protein [Nocardioides nanhaiensis]|uniref:Uncharacterized protein n=1 Tax=Nocardioides nanhaiensis TaxID=1476871 RepID=A0ABP8X1K2_9ACTN
MSEKLTASETIQTLTGFEEIAIEAHMGVEIYSEGQAKPMRVMRALVFVQRMRDGDNAHEARKVAMEMPMRELQDHFAPELEEIDPDAPDTPEGKGNSASA